MGICFHSLANPHCLAESTLKSQKEFNKKAKYMRRIRRILCCRSSLTFSCFHCFLLFLVVFWEFPNLVVSNLVVCYLHRSALLCSFADLRLLSFALICGFLRPTAFRTTACAGIPEKGSVKEIKFKEGLASLGAPNLPVEPLGLHNQVCKRFLV